MPISAPRRCIALCGVMLLAVGCAGLDPGPPVAPSSPEAQLTLLIGSEVVIAIAEPGRVDLGVVSYRGYSWSYNKGRIMNEAAFDVFGRVFPNVTPAVPNETPTFTLSITGDSSMNPAQRMYYASVNATVLRGNQYGTPLATFRGSGKQWAGLNDASGFEQAYRMAFRDIVQQMLANDVVRSALESRLN